MSELVVAGADGAAERAGPGAAGGGATLGARTNAGRGASGVTGALLGTAVVALSTAGVIANLVAEDTSSFRDRCGALFALATAEPLACVSSMKSTIADASIAITAMVVPTRERRSGARG